MLKYGWRINGIAHWLVSLMFLGQYMQFEGKHQEPLLMAIWAMLGAIFAAIYDKTK